MLSNNDGCVIALTPELKAIGVKMGTPYFQCRQLIEKHGGVVFSSNYELYGNMSIRLMDTLGYLAETVEVYSIDEAFLDLSHIPKDCLIREGHRIRNTVFRWTGLPVGVGIAETKTLAKIANKLAKKNGGVVSLYKREDIDEILKTIPIMDIWGIKDGFANRLQARNIKTAYDLKYADDKWLKKNFPITLVRTVYELRGISCKPMTECPPPKKGIMNSRAFGAYVEDLSVMRSAITFHATRGGEELRAQKLCASAVMVFITTNQFNPKHPQYHKSCIIPLPHPSDCTPDILRAALKGLEKIWKDGYEYKKAGVMLMDLVPLGVRQRSLLENRDPVKGKQLMNAVDGINRKQGRGAVRYATEGFEREWAMLREKKSPAYTTSWDELLVV